MYAFAGTILSSLALIACTARTLQGYGYMDGVINDEHYHDLGKLMFGFTVFWAYIAYSMFMLIWYANLPERDRVVSQALGKRLVDADLDADPAALPGSVLWSSGTHGEAAPNHPQSDWGRCLL